MLTIFCWVLSPTGTSSNQSRENNNRRRKKSREGKAEIIGIVSPIIEHFTRYLRHCCLRPALSLWVYCLTVIFDSVVNVRPETCEKISRWKWEKNLWRVCILFRMTVHSTTHWRRGFMSSEREDPFSHRGRGMCKVSVHHLPLHIISMAAPSRKKHRRQLSTAVVKFTQFEVRVAA